MRTETLGGVDTRTSRGILSWIITSGQTRALVRLAAIATITALAASACARRQSNRAQDPTNELPFGALDSPPEGAKLTMVSNAGGWALDDRGIREIRLYVDGHFINATPLNTQRPDVAKAFPQYTKGSDLVGFTAVVEFPTPGPHTLVVQAVDTDGATRDIGAIKVEVTG